TPDATENQKKNPWHPVFFQCHPCTSCANHKAGLTNFSSFIPISRHWIFDSPSFCLILSRSIPARASRTAQVQRHISKEIRLLKSAALLMSSSKYSSRRADHGKSRSRGSNCAIYSR